MTGAGPREPDWLAWAREMQAIAQNGLAFTRDPFDRERFEQLQALAARVAGAHTDTQADRIAALFGTQEGYATPKVDVRAAIFDDAGRILMVREVLDEHRWTLPGGWADINLTPAENAEKEAREESGFEVRARKLAAVWDRTRQGHGAYPFSTYKLFFVCEIVGGAARPSVETSEIAFFAEDALPDDLSTGRILHTQILRMFAHWRTPSLPTEFE